MVNRFRLCSVFILSALCLFSCRKEEDQDLPVISSPAWDLSDGSFFENDTLYVLANNALRFSADLSDDEALNQYRLRFDPESSSELHPDQGNYLFQDISSLNGTEGEVTFDVTLGELLRGSWNFELSLLDESGKQASPYAQAVEILNPNLPVLQLDSLGSSTSFQNLNFSVGASFLMHGNVSCQQPLDYLELTYFQGGNSLSTSNFFLSGTSFDLTELGTLSLPGNLEGDFTLHATFYSQDNLGLKTVMRGTVN